MLSFLLRPFRFLFYSNTNNTFTETRDRDIEEIEKEYVIHPYILDNFDTETIHKMIEDRKGDIPETAKITLPSFLEPKAKSELIKPVEAPTSILTSKSTSKSISKIEFEPEIISKNASITKKNKTSSSVEKKCKKSKKKSSKRKKTKEKRLRNKQERIEKRQRKKHRYNLRSKN
jgi:hypothetical protein